LAIAFGGRPGLVISVIATGLAFWRGHFPVPVYAIVLAFGVSAASHFLWRFPAAPPPNSTDRGAEI